MTNARVFVAPHSGVEPDCYGLEGHTLFPQVRHRSTTWVLPPLLTVLQTVARLPGEVLGLLPTLRHSTKPVWFAGSANRVEPPPRIELGSLRYQRSELTVVL